MAQRTIDNYGGYSTKNPTAPKIAGYSKNDPNRTTPAHQAGFAVNKSTNTSGTKNTAPVAHVPIPSKGMNPAEQAKRDAAAQQNAGSGWGGYSYGGGGSSSSSSSNDSYSSSSVDYAAQQAAAERAAQEEAARKERERLEALRLAIEAQKKARQDAIDAANAALDKQGQNARDQYNASRVDVGNNYQDLRNQLAVQNFKARRAQREAQADRGAFNSGNGMQENLMLSSNYNNNMNRINREETSAYNTLLNNLNNYLGQINLPKANNQNSTLENFNNVISSLINAEYSGYTPDAGYLALAQSIAGNTPTVAVSPTTVAQTSAAGIANDLYNTLNTNSARGISNNDIYNTLLRYGIR
jgi:hypothetical protein